MERRSSISELSDRLEAYGWAGFTDLRENAKTPIWARPSNTVEFSLGNMLGFHVRDRIDCEFEKATDSKGNASGYLFKSDDQTDLSLLANHPVPQVLVIRDEGRRTFHWAVLSEHVLHRTTSASNTPSVEVPFENALDSEGAKRLAGFVQARFPDSTNRFRAQGNHSELDAHTSLRHALLVPRVLIPELGNQIDEVSGAQALALHTLFRSELDRTFNGYFHCPSCLNPIPTVQPMSLEEALQSNEFGWKLTAALHLHFFHDSPEALEDLRPSAQDPHEAATAAVINCVRYMDEGALVDALAVIEELLGRWELSPVDTGWAKAQRARINAASGKPAVAFDEAVGLLGLWNSHTHDITALAISGASCDIAFSAARSFMRAFGVRGWTHRVPQVEESWWREVIAPFGTGSYLKTFLNQELPKVGGTPEHFDLMHRALMSSSLLASVMADHQNWQSLQVALALRCLRIQSTRTNRDIAVKSIRRLWAADADIFAHNELLELVANGPVEIPHKLLSDLTNASPDSFIRLGEYSTVALADLLSTEAANAVTRTALTSLGDKSPAKPKGTATNRTAMSSMRIIRASIFAVSEDVVHEVVEWVLSTPTNLQVLRFHLAALVAVIPITSWSDEQVTRARARFNDLDDELGSCFAPVVAAFPDAGGDVTLRRDTNDDIDVLKSISDIRALSERTASSLLDSMYAHSSVENDVFDETEMPPDMWQFQERLGSTLQSIALLNIHHPGVAQWTRIRTILKNETADPRYAAGALKVLARAGRQLEPKVRSELLDAVLFADTHDSFNTSFDPDLYIRSDDDFGVLAAEAVAALGAQSSVQNLISKLLSGDARSRASAARIIERFGEPSDEKVLITLVGDSNAYVQRAALTALAHFVRKRIATADACSLLEDHLAQGARGSARAIMSRLNGAKDVPEVRSLLRIARYHPAASVRALSSHIESNTGQTPSTSCLLTSMFCATGEELTDLIGEGGGIGVFFKHDYMNFLTTVSTGKENPFPPEEFSCDVYS